MGISPDQNESRSIVQYTAVDAISADAGTTIRRRYQGRLAQW
jgi:hypothetical protein